LHARVPELRASSIARLIRDRRLIAVLRGIQPQATLVALIDELVDAGVRVIEITFDSPSAAADVEAVRARLPAGGPDPCAVGGGTLRTPEHIRAAVGAGADFGVSPVLDPAILDLALEAGFPFVPAAYSPTEADLAWRRGATFVKLFPGSSLGPAHVRELRGPLPEIETIVTGGVDGANARAFLDAGAVAVGIGSALVGATADERRAIVAATRS
jgi:2-dehydro-3-deoxyphosphogluconate aldolase / (4S)-4-hydroxy-2-oxoglutarate aldolase